MWAWVAEGGGWVLHGGVGGICHRRFDEIVKINERIPAPRKCRGLLFFSRPPVDDFHPLEGDGSPKLCVTRNGKCKSGIRARIAEHYGKRKRDIVEKVRLQFQCLSLEPL